MTVIVSRHADRRYDSALHVVFANIFAKDSLKATIYEFQQRFLIIMIIIIIIIKIATKNIKFLVTYSHQSKISPFLKPEA
jgi:hypothetical protein